jgi:catechol 2,3-dioxygenase-like lactoylglutathione lyase family enzyme
MTASATVTRHPPVQGLHHSAYRCRDAEETRHFYEDVLGFPLVVSLCMDRNPATGETVTYNHLFFDIGSHNPEEPNYIAFFDVVDHPGDDPARLFHKRWGLDLHFAMRVPDHAALEAWRQRLLSHGLTVEGPIDHGIITSIYFFDPNGYRLELTTEGAAGKAAFARERTLARANLARWTAWKRERGPDPKSAIG